MGHPPLPIGTAGRIKVYPTGDMYRARARFRDYDGVTRHVERVGRSRTAAENNLREALRDRGRTARHGEITADSTVGTVAEMWLRDIDESDRALRTKITYRDVWNKHLDPAVAALRLRDVRVSRVDRVIRELRQRSGEGTAKHAKVILSGVLGLAVRLNALDSNPVRERAPSRSKSKREKVVIDEPGMAKLGAFLAESADAQKYDLADLVAVLSGLGCRIGELLALDWPRVDDKAGTVAMEGTVIRCQGRA